MRWITRLFRLTESMRLSHRSKFSFNRMQEKCSLQQTFNQLQKAHFGLPCVRPWDNGGKCHMNDACQTHRNIIMYPSIFNRFPVIQPVSSKVRHFSTFAHFGLPWVRPWDNHGKCYMHGKRIQCWSNALPAIRLRADLRRMFNNNKRTHLSSTVYEL